MVRYNGVTRGGVRLDAPNLGNGASGMSTNRFSAGMGGAVSGCRGPGDQAAPTSLPRTQGDRDATETSGGAAVAGHLLQPGDPLLHGPVKAPAGAIVNDPDGISPREKTRPA